MTIVTDLDAIKIIGQIAAPAGIAIGAFLYFARDVVAKNIFPVLTKERAYHLIISLAVMAWSIALAGIGAWVYVEANKKVATEKKEQAVKSQLHTLMSEYGMELNFEAPECNTKKNNDIFLAPKSIYFPSEYLKDEGRHVPSFKITSEASETVKASIDWIVQFGDRVCLVFVFAGVDIHSSREYNLALGQKLADTIRRQLVVGGINEDLIESISFGEERAKKIFVASAQSSLEKDFNNFARIGVVLR